MGATVTNDWLQMFLFGQKMIMMALTFAYNDEAVKRMHEFARRA